jgi:hypothetical protein
LVYKGGHAAVDYCKAVSNLRDTHNRLMFGSMRGTIDNGPCRFHNNPKEDFDEQYGSSCSSRECPFQATECFPDKPIPISSTHSPESDHTKVLLKKKSEKQTKRMTMKEAVSEGRAQVVGDVLPADEPFPVETKVCGP